MTNFDLLNDFYELIYSEMSELDDIRRKYKYSGKNSLGREPVRQFLYKLQNLHENTIGNYGKKE